MRIVHVVNKLDPADGGPPAMVMRLACAQRSLGAAPVLVAMDGPGQRERVAEGFAHLRDYSGLTIQLLERSRLIAAGPSSSARANLAGVIRGADFVHIHGMWQPILLHAARFARALQIPYALSAHGMLSRWSLQQKRLKKFVALHSFWRGCLAQAAFVHTLNAEECEHVGDLGLPITTVVLGNGVDIEELHASTPGTASMSVPAGRFILFLGRLHYSKGIDVLVAAFARIAERHRDVDLVLVGPDFGYEQQVRRQISELGIARRVHIMGALYGPAKMAVVRAAESFCLPSRQEGFSIALLEAMAAGLPVVASEDCHFPQAATGGMIVPVNVDAVCGALDDLCSNPEQRAQLGAAGKVLIEREYTWPSISRQMLEAYRRHGGLAKVVGSSPQMMERA